MLEIVTSTLAGGLTGYFTNDFAIKMLFKEYFGFGGVIQKEYKEFIKNISILIEKDLINHDTLKNEIEKEEFKQSIEEIVKQLFLIELPKINGNKNFYSYDTAKTTQNLVPYFQTFQNMTFDEIKDKNLNNIISKSQFEIINSNINSSIDKVELNNILYKFCENKKIDELLTEETINKTTKKLESLINIDYKKFDGDIDKIYDKFMSKINIREILDNVENSINQMKLKDFVNNSHNISEELLKRIKIVLKDNESILREFLEKLLISLKSIDNTVFDFLNNSAKEDLKVFIRAKFPILINSIIEFINLNKEELENLINKDIDEVLSNDVLGTVLKGLKNIFYDDFVKENNFIGKIINFIQNYDEKSVDVIVDKMIELLETFSIGEMIKKSKLNVDIILNLIYKNLDDLDINLDEFLDKKVENIYKIELNEELIYKIFLNLKEKYIYTDKFKNSINLEINKTINSLKQKEIKTFIDKFEFDINLKVPENMKLKEIVSTPNFKYNLPDFVLNSLYCKLQNEKTYNNIQKLTHFVLSNKLKNLLTGNVSLAVSKELNKFEPVQIKDMVENFMGKELKPINYLGAILGGIAGAGYYGATVAVANPYLHYATPLVYGVTGIITNKLAINMLFKPYEKKAWLPYFSPGVVAKNKPAFATNIANFVKNDILTDEALIQLFETHKEEWIKFLKEFVSKNNYEVIDNLLKENSEIFAEKGYQLLLEYLENNNEFLADKIVEIIKTIKFDEDNLSQKIVQKFHSYDFSEFYKYVENYLSSQKLTKFIPYFIGFLKQNNLFIDKLLLSLDIDNLKKLAFEYEKEYQQFIVSKSLNLEGLNDVIIKFIKSDKINDLFLNKKLNQMFDGKLVSVIESNISYLIDIGIDKLQNNKREIKNTILEKMNGFQRVVAGNKVELVIDKIIDKTLPQFLKSKEPQLVGIANHLLDYKLSDMGIRIDEHKSKLILNITNSFLSTFSKVTLDKYLKILNINNLRELIEILDIPLNNLSIILEKNIKNIDLDLSDFENILINIFDKTTLKDVVEFKEDYNKIISLIKSDKQFMSDLELFLKESLSKLFSEPFYNDELLKQNIAKFILTLQPDIKPFLKDVIVNINNIIDNSLKETFLDELVEAVFKSIEVNLSNISNSLDLKTVIEREINNMNPQEIEKLFRSFAGSYFNKLEVYGGFGAIFGVPSMFL